MLVNVASDKYLIEEEYVSKVLPNTNLETLLQELTIEGEAELEIYNGTEKLNNSDLIKTGTIMKIKTNQAEKDIILVVRGDLTGDGLMTEIDLLKLARYRVGLDKTLKEEHIRAADIYEDKKYADDLDLLKMARILVGLDEL